MHILQCKLGPAKQKKGKERKGFVLYVRQTKQRLAGNVPVSTWIVVAVVVFSLWAGASEMMLCCKLDWRVRLCVGLMVRRVWSLIMCSFCGELRGRSAGVGQTLTGVPALPEGSSQRPQRKPSSNVRREMLSKNKSTQSENLAFKL